MKSFQLQDSFHLHTMLSHFLIFKNYHIEVFQKEYKKIMYASNNPTWNDTYIQKSSWESDTILKYSQDHDHGVYLFSWPEDFLKAREVLKIQSGFSKLTLAHDFMQIIHVCSAEKNLEKDVASAFDSIELLLENDVSPETALVQT